MKYVYPRIRDLREDNDLTQEHLANRLNLHLTQYRRYETGESEVPVHIVKELALFYNVSSDYLIGITNEPTAIK
ncbi:MAG: helix-turn-helix transcriptional regulator [Clostridia bacterium]|nr:helix-turn-helix transcriptional regulator [Clostridia bacterium]